MDSLPSPVLPVSLKALGYLEIEDRAGRPIVQLLRRPKQSALFCAVALGERGVRSCDRLMAMFWPEASAAKARHSLAQTLYRIRQDLEVEVIVRRGDQILVLEQAVSSDVDSFERAAREGRHADATALYRGDLLDGLYLSDAPDFEKWVERERIELKRIAARSLWSWAEALSDRSALTEASDIAKRAADLFPGEEATTQRLLRFLDAIGDRAQAVHAFQEFTSFVRREYGMEPSPETVALARAIRERGSKTGLSAASADMPKPLIEPFPSSLASTQSTELLPVHRERTRAFSHRLSWFAAALAASVLALIVGSAMTSRGISDAADPLRVAVVTDPTLGERVGGAFGVLRPDVAERSARELAQELAAVRGVTIVPQAMVAGIDWDRLNDEMGVGSIVAVDAWSDPEGVRTLVQIIDPIHNGVVAHQSFPDSGTPVDIARFVRQRIGDMQRTRSLRAALPDSATLRRLAEADWLVARGVRHADQGRSRMAWAFLVEADSVLAEAEGAAPHQAGIILARGWVAHQSFLALSLDDPVDDQEPGVAGLHSLARRVLQREEVLANRALAADAGSPFALELRGAARFGMLQLVSFQDDTLAAQVEADLTAATTSLSSLERAWARLAALRRARGDFGGALVALRRSLEADAYLRHDLSTRRMLVLTAIMAGDRETAERECADGSLDFPNDPTFRECRLALMSWFPELADPTAAWGIFSELSAAGPQFQTTRNLRGLRLVASLANAGLVDSARVLFEQERRRPNGPDSVRTDMAAVRVLVLLGSIEEAISAAEAFVAAFPSYRPLLRTDPQFAGLRDSRRFQTLLRGIETR